MTSGREQLRQLAEDFGGKIPPEVRRELRPKFRTVVAPTVDKVKDKASWSTRIPGATKLSTSLGRRPGVRIVVNAKKAPHARPYEDRGQWGAFRHPVFGHRDRWVAQRSRPFLFNTVAADADRIAQGVADVVPEVARKHGFH
jgi:hypothetical protein